MVTDFIFPFLFHQKKIRENVYINNSLTTHHTHTKRVHKINNKIKKENNMKKMRLMKEKKIAMKISYRRFIHFMS